MAANDMTPCQPRKKTRTTVQAADLPGRPDRLHRNFTANAPAVTWVGDITYIPTWQGFVYLATVMDCFSKKIIGYAMAGHMRTELISQALAMATRVCPPVRGATVFHSDRGSQYTSAEYAKIMADHEILPSVGRTGICYDNAAAESFNGTLKKELVNRKVYPTRTHPNPGRDILDRAEIQSQTTPAQRSTTAHPTKSTPNGDATARQPEPDIHHCPKNLLHSSRLRWGCCRPGCRRPGVCRRSGPARRWVGRCRTVRRGVVVRGCGAGWPGRAGCSGRGRAGGIRPLAGRHRVSRGCGGTGLGFPCGPVVW